MCVQILRGAGGEGEERNKRKAVRKIDELGKRFAYVAY